MFDMQAFGRRIAEARRAAGLTQPDLAEKMGISFQAVSNWERGESMPDIAKLPELAAILGMSIDALLGVVPMPTQNASDPAPEPEPVPEPTPDPTTEPKSASASVLKQLRHMAEYIDSENIVDIVRTHLDAGDITDLGDLSDLSYIAECMDSEDVSDLAELLIERGLMRAEQLRCVAEQMDSVDLADLLSDLARMGKADFADLMRLASCMDEDDVAEAAKVIIGLHGATTAQLDFLGEIVCEDDYEELPEINKNTGSKKKFDNMDMPEIKD